MPADIGFFYYARTDYDSRKRAERQKEIELEARKTREAENFIANIKEEEEKSLQDKLATKLVDLFDFEGFIKFYAILKKQYEKNIKELDLLRLSTIFHMLEFLEPIDKKSWVATIKVDEYIAAAFMMALKSSNDRCVIDNKIFSKYMGMSLTRLNACEVKIMEKIGINVPSYPSDALNETYRLDLNNHANLKKFYSSRPLGSKSKIIKTEKLRLAIMKKASQLQERMLSGVLLNYENCIDTYYAHVEERADPLNKKTVIEKYRRILRSKKSHKEKISEFYKALDNKDEIEMLKANNNGLALFFASITLIPAIILAIQSKWFSSKNTFCFWKSHGDILLSRDLEKALNKVNRHSF